MGYPNDGPAIHQQWGGGGGAQILLLLHATKSGITAGLVFNFKQMKGLLFKETMVPCQWGQDFEKGPSPKMLDFQSSYRPYLTCIIVGYLTFLRTENIMQPRPKSS